MKRTGGIRIAAAALALVLMCGGCSKSEAGLPPETESVQTFPVETEHTQADTQRLSLENAASDKLKGYLWPRESVRKDIMGEEVEFILYHGNGWTIQVPASWEETLAGEWEAPSHCASFGVGKCFLGMETIKWYRAQAGSWRHETSYAPPFDYYYDDDGGYTPPAGNADYIYFFAPAGETQSYEFTLKTVVGETSEAEKCIQKAMLLSFCLDESSHVLNSEAYTPGMTEWEAAMAGLAAETERIWFSWYHDDTLTEVDGKGRPDYFAYFLTLEAFRPEEFVEMFFGEGPEELKASREALITLCLPELGIWLYFYDNSPWVCVHHAGEDYWARFRHKDDPDERIFDAVRGWLEAEHLWADSPAGALDGGV